MPGSSRKGKFKILEWRQCLPEFKYVLDVGPGWGTYAKLLKRKKEIWHAVEIHEPYVEKFKLNNLYNKIYITSITDFSPGNSSSSKEFIYDLTILGDVLEHLTKENAKNALKNVFKFSKYCLVSLPLGEQTDAELNNYVDYWKNQYERHLACWTNLEFIRTIEDLGGEIISLFKYEDIGIYLLSCKKENTFLCDNISCFDYLKHHVLSIDSDKQRKTKVRLTITGLIPVKIKKMLKKYFFKNRV